MNTSRQAAALFRLPDRAAGGPGHARAVAASLVPPGEVRAYPSEADANRDPEASAGLSVAPSGLVLWARAARLHQWVKNLLIFVPLVLAGEALNASAWATAAAGFLAFGLVASATYLLNDLHDLADDRAHPSKCHRPLASGALAIRQALVAAVLGLCGGLALAGGVAGSTGLVLLAGYIAATLAYTFCLKKQPVIETVTLAGLFTWRLVAGIYLVGVAASPWLLIFSMFVFGSLALAKRYVEISRLAVRGLTKVQGRGYVAADGPAVLALGTGSGMAAVLVFVLYLTEAALRHAFYVSPERLWIAPVALFIWLARIWLLCGRGELNDDPVEFATSDAPSIGLGLAILASFALACV
jgi:4-hydroxybenzoate polyprenyltransferase